MDGNTDELSSVTKAFRILELIRDNESATLTEVATELSLPKSTAYRYLSTLVANEYLVREDDEYRVSYVFLEFANHIRTRNPANSLIEAKVEELAEEVEELAQFIVQEYDRAVYVFQASSGHGVRVGSYAKTFGPLHSTAGGKAILSTWEPEPVEAFISRSGLPEITADTITNPDALIEELDAIRERGYSINDQENVEGLKAVSVPVCEPNGRAIGALSVAGPTNRMDETRLQGLSELLLSASNEVELNLRLM